ncbi:MAG TPA: PilZ domain-containing protein [Candidatus Acidoferrales bacterium]
MQTPKNGPTRSEIPPLGERRAVPRYRPKSFTYVNVGDSNGGIVSDASESGLQITTAQTVTAGERIELLVQTAMGEEPIEATGRAVWLSDSRKTAGLQFVEVTDDSRRRIREWIARNGGDAELPIQKPAPSKQSVPLTEELEKMFPLEGYVPERPAAKRPGPKPPAPRPRASAPALRVATPRPLASDPTPQPATQSPHPAPQFPTQLHRALYEVCREPQGLSEPPARSVAARITVIVCAILIAAFVTSIIVGRFPFWPRSSNDAPPASATNAPAPAADPSQTTMNQTAAGGSAPSTNSLQPDEGTPNATSARNAEAPSAATNAPPPTAGGPPATGETSADTSSVPQAPDDKAILVTPPAPGSDPALVTLPQQAVTASDVVAIGVQSSALVSPTSGSQHRTERLEFGMIAASPPAVSLPAAVARESGSEIVRLRAVIDEQGEIKSLDATHGRTDLIPLSENLVRQWSQTPARLNGKPIQSFEDITLSFRGGR